MARIVLESMEGVNTPHFLATMILSYRNEEDRDEILSMFCNGFSTVKGRGGPDEAIFHKLLLGRIPYKVDGDTVVFWTQDTRR
jgi:hypothetical protein